LITAPHNIFEDRNVIKAGLNHHQYRNEMEQEFHGIMPNYFEATLSEFSDEFNDYEGWDWYFYGVSFRSSLSLGE
jgi:hypothetical protein